MIDVDPTKWTIKTGLSVKVALNQRTLLFREACPGTLEKFVGERGVVTSNVRNRFPDTGSCQSALGPIAVSNAPIISAFERQYQLSYKLPFTLADRRLGFSYQMYFIELKF